MKYLCNTCNWNKITAKTYKTANKEYSDNISVVKCSAYIKSKKINIPVEWKPINPCNTCDVEGCEERNVVSYDDGNRYNAPPIFTIRERCSISASY
jgi:hypothetical protein